MQSHFYEDSSIWNRRRNHHLTKTVTVRLSKEEIDILNRFVPADSLSFQIRSAIHALQRHGGLSQG